MKIFFPILYTNVEYVFLNYYYYYYWLYVVYVLFPKDKTFPTLESSAHREISRSPGLPVIIWREFSYVTIYRKTWNARLLAKICRTFCLAKYSTASRSAEILGHLWTRNFVLRICRFSTLLRSDTQTENTLCQPRGTTRRRNRLCKRSLKLPIGQIHCSGRCAEKYISP